MDYEQQAEKAVLYLASTDEAHANAKALLSGLQEGRKTVKAIQYMKAIEQGKAQGVAEQMAYKSDEYAEIISKISDAELEYLTLTNKRKRAELTIELFRTMSANQRRGNV